MVQALGKTNYNEGFRFRLYLLLLLSFSCVVLDAVGGFVEKSSFVFVVNTKSLVEVDLLEWYVQVRFFSTISMVRLQSLIQISFILVIQHTFISWDCLPVSEQGLQDPQPNSLQFSITNKVTTSKKHTAKLYHF